MAHAEYRNLTKRAVDRRSVNGGIAVFRDRDLAGFSTRVCPNGKKAAEPAPNLMAADFAWCHFREHFEMRCRPATVTNCRLVQLLFP